MEAAVRLTGPSVNRHRSVQVVATPWEFIHAVEAKFGKLVVDLAATESNAKCDRFITPELDTFKQDWCAWLNGGLGRSNPEFDPMKKWVAMCASQARNGAEFLMLAPAAVSTNWFWDHVQPYATVYCITPRLVFADNYQMNPAKPKYGELITDPYPKDLMLAHYCAKPDHELQRWNWKR